MQDLPTPEKYAYFCKHDDTQVKGFFGPYRYLSNFHICEITHRGRAFPTSEHAYMFAKLENPTDVDYDSIKDLTAGQVKKWGQTIPLRPDWEEVKYQMMREILFNKFTNNADVRQWLIDTGDRYLEESNSWQDTYWGVDIKWGGQNNLGKILMEIRNHLKG